MSSKLNTFRMIDSNKKNVNEFAFDNKDISEWFLTFMLERKTNMDIKLDFPTDRLSFPGFIMQHYAVAFAKLIQNGLIDDVVIKENGLESIIEMMKINNSMEMDRGAIMDNQERINNYIDTIFNRKAA
jgi:hypothetical protein